MWHPGDTDLTSLSDLLERLDRIIELLEQIVENKTDDKTKPA
jgi:hypothetical protein